MGRKQLKECGERKGSVAKSGPRKFGRKAGQGRSDAAVGLGQKTCIVLWDQGVSM